MTTKTKWIVGISIALALAVGITIIVIRKSRKKKLEENAHAAAENVASNLPPNPNGRNRGLKNNNPGNIRISGSAWKGKIPIGQNTDGAFEQFTDKVFGVRAMIATLRTYMNTHGIKTLTGIIQRYAPGNENPTAQYVENVSKATGIDPNQELKFNKETLKKIVTAMATMESGQGAITTSEFNEAWAILA